MFLPRNHQTEQSSACIERSTRKELRDLQIWSAGGYASIAWNGVHFIRRVLAHFSAHGTGKPDADRLCEQVRGRCERMPFCSVRSRHVVGPPLRGSLRFRFFYLRRDRPAVKRGSSSSTGIHITDGVGNEPLVIVRPLDKACKLDGLARCRSRHDSVAIQGNSRQVG